MAATQRRTTRQRRAVAAILSDTAAFISAQDLHLRLRRRGETIGLATVYRTLAAMAQDEQVDMLRAPDGEARYRLCATEGHHHHLVCRECGRTVEIEGPTVESWADDVAAEHGFVDVSHTVEVFGTCASCATTAESRASSPGRATGPRDDPPGGPAVGPSGEPGAGPRDEAGGR